MRFFLMILVLLAFAPSANAHTVLTRSDAIAHLKANYDEVPVARGLTENGGMLEVLASPTGDTWTILLTTPGGLTTLLLSGEAWLKIIPGNDS